MQKQLLEKFLFLIAFVSAKTHNSTNLYVVFCYWGTWSHYREGNGKFEVSNINPNLCTHIGYAFFGLNDNYEIESLHPKLDYDLENIAKTIALKEKNYGLKVLASIGGWSAGSEKFSAMADTASTRLTFINSVLQFLKKHKFDGLDLDWEYPAQRGGSESDRTNFVMLLSELNAILKTHGLLLTIAVAASPASANISYDISHLSSHIDLINVMSYSFASPRQLQTGFKSTLQGNGEKNVKSAIEFWLENGASANKLVLGLAFNGRSFTLADSKENWIGAPAIGNGTAGPITKKSGILGYNEICENLKLGWMSNFNETYLMPYAYNDTQWVGYDDGESFRFKIDFMKERHLRGVLIWSIETDDFRGNCGEAYPLLNAINKHLKSNSTVKAEKLTSTSETKKASAYYFIFYIFIAIIFVVLLLSLCCCSSEDQVKISLLSAFLVCLLNCAQN